MSAWITVVGIGEDGLAGLGEGARALVESAEVLVGGDRHLAHVPEGRAERLTWGQGFSEAMDEIERRRGRRIVVLASGDPMDFGAGATLARRFGPEALTVIPAPGAFSLACARMGWSRPDVATLTVHGRSIDALNLAIAPGTRLVILSADGTTPAAVARLLVERGFGASAITVLEHLGGPDEARIEGVAETWQRARCRDLNTVAVDCRAGENALAWPRVPGLAESAFEHDGQITKREVRSMTLAALGPLPFRVLWDVGAGSGAVAIEWLRAEPSGTAVAVERDAERAARIARNAARLGVPALRVVTGEAPAALAGLEPRPDAVFVGGGIAEPGVLEACWRALGPGGRLVANAVTLEGEARLLAWRADHGGEVVRLSVARAEAIGGRTAFRPLLPVTQYVGVKRALSPQRSAVSRNERG